jgi:cephalosporin-C deacetylase
MSTNTLFDRHKASFPFDPTYGLTLDELRRIKGPGPEREPSDFDAFWRDSFRQNAEIALEQEEKPSTFTHEGYKITEIYFNTLDSWRVGGWLCVPEKLTDAKTAVVCGHGYGGRAEPDHAILDGQSAVLFVCAPGFNLSANPERVVPDSAVDHVICGIESPQTYILRACAAAYWSAAELMKRRFPSAPLLYRGYSFGGGIGALMLPWQRLYVGAELGQPTFSYHSFRLKNPSQGSAEVVRKLYQRTPEIEKTLGYYESVFAARRIQVPIVYALSVFDPAVPAAGQFAVANATAPEFRTVVVMQFGHYDVIYHQQTTEQKRIAAEVAALYDRSSRWAHVRL